MPLEVVREEISPNRTSPIRLHAPPEAAPRKPLDEQVLQVISALSAVLAVRAVMALAVVGSFALAYLAIQSTSDRALWVFGLYTVTVLGPLIWLVGQRRQ